MPSKEFAASGGVIIMPAQDADKMMKMIKDTPEVAAIFLRNQKRFFSHSSEPTMPYSHGGVVKIKA